MSRFQIVFMGTPEFACPSLEALINGPDKVLAVVTQPDRPRGRGRQITPSPVKTLAMKNGIEVLQPQKVREPGFPEKLAALRPDLLVVVAYGQILPQVILDIPQIMPVNIHGSLLPAYRGAAPIQWSILNGEKETGITIMRMDTGMDTGPMLLKEAIEIGENEPFGSLYQRLSLLGANLLMKSLEMLSNHCLTQTPQPKDGISTAPPIKPEMSQINWYLPAQKVFCQIRAFDPAPGASTILNGQKIKLFTPELSLTIPKDSTRPGEILAVEKNGLHIACAQGSSISVKEILIPGRKRMSVSDIMRGSQFFVPGDLCISLA